MSFAKRLVVADVPAQPEQPRAEIVALDEVPENWDAAWADLAANASEPNPFYEHWMLRPAIEHLRPPRAGRLVTVWQGAALIGLFPVSVEPQYGRLPLRHVENWSHYHCFYGAPLVRAGQEQLFWQTALDALDATQWTTGFLHLVGIDHAGPVFAALSAVRRTDIVHRSTRAMLASNLSPTAYYETHVRKKKRKEIGRLRSRLDELGVVAFETLAVDTDPDAWITDFLELEAAGWKGREGSALGADTNTRAFFAQSIRTAHGLGKLDMLRLTLEGQSIAMLVNLLIAPGSFSFKIAFDETYARFSPGVLIQLENLKLLDRSDIDWMDSCAVEDHPMINSLWAERRDIVRVTTPLKSGIHRVKFHGARALERAAAVLKGRA